jgi:hypothetical protein
MDGMWRYRYNTILSGMYIFRLATLLNVGLVFVELLVILLVYRVLCSVK